MIHGQVVSGVMAHADDGVEITLSANKRCASYFTHIVENPVCALSCTVDGCPPCLPRTSTRPNELYLKRPLERARLCTFTAKVKDASGKAVSNYPVYVQHALNAPPWFDLRVAITNKHGKAKTSYILGPSNWEGIIAFPVDAPELDDPVSISNLNNSEGR